VMGFTRSLRTRRWLGVWAVLGVLVASGFARAAEKVVVVSLKPATQLFSDVEYLLDATGMAGLGQFFLPQVKVFFQGVDNDKPIGAVVMVEETEFKVMGFVPVKDLKAVLGQLQEQLGEPKELENGVFELRGPQPMFVKEQDGWAYLAQSPEALTDLPAAPATLLEGLDEKYDIAVRAFGKNVPQPLKEVAIAQMRAQMEQGMEQAAEENEDEEAQAQAKLMVDAQMTQITQLIQEMETLTLGWQIDPTNRHTMLDMSVTAMPGTKMAAQMSQMSEAKTEYASFQVPDSAIKMGLASIIPADQIETAVAQIDQIQSATMSELEEDDSLDDEGRTNAKQLATMVFDIFRSTMRSGAMDAGMSVMMGEKSVTMVAAAHVASGTEVAEAVKKLLDVAKETAEGGPQDVKLNAGEHAGVTLHTMSLPLPEGEALAAVMGDKVPVVLGTAEKSVYMAVGNDAMETLKGLLDKSQGATATKTDPGSIEVALGPILKFAQSMESNPVLDMVAEQVANAQGKDRIQIRSMAVGENGVTYRIQIDEGVLRAMGQAGQAANMQQEGDF